MSQSQPQPASTQPTSEARTPTPDIVTDLRGLEGLNDLLGVLGRASG